jgi:hypothetical protein
MRPSARARSAAERIYCSSSPSVKATPFDAEGRKGVIGQAGKATIFGTSRTGIVTANGGGKVALREILVHTSFG